MKKSNIIIVVVVIILLTAGILAWVFLFSKKARLKRLNLKLAMATTDSEKAGIQAKIDKIEKPTPPPPPPAGTPPPPPTGTTTPTPTGTTTTTPTVVEIIPSDDFPIRPSSKGHWVVLMQMALKHTWGQDVEVDGKFGNKDRIALINKFWKFWGATYITAKSNLRYFVAMEINKNQFNEITRGLDVAKLMGKYPSYRTIWNQYGKP